MFESSDCGELKRGRGGSNLPEHGASTPLVPQDSSCSENGFPNSVQLKAKQAWHETWGAESKATAKRAFDVFLETDAPKYPKPDQVDGKIERR